jgi:hypothetical protein
MRIRIHNPDSLGGYSGDGDLYNSEDSHPGGGPGPVLRSLRSPRPQDTRLCGTLHHQARKIAFPNYTLLYLLKNFFLLKSATYSYTVPYGTLGRSVSDSELYGSSSFFGLVG